MSEIVVFGAGGRAGQQAVAEARRRGHRVTAVVRDPAKYGLPDTVAGDVTDAARVAELTKGKDAVISAAAVYGAGTDPQKFFTDSARALAAVNSRVIVVGLSSLLADESGELMMDTPGFPAEFRPFCLAHRDGLDILRATDGLDWLYVSPAGDFDHEGARAGHYRISEHGDAAARITYADFALALLDEAETPKHTREHLAVTL
jgi:putative NADH-flavin reductase